MYVYMYLCIHCHMNFSSIEGHVFLDVFDQLSITCLLLMYVCHPVFYMNCLNDKKCDQFINGFVC